MKTQTQRQSKPPRFSKRSVSLPDDLWVWILNEAEGDIDYGNASNCIRRVLGQWRKETMAARAAAAAAAGPNGVPAK